VVAHVEEREDRVSSLELFFDLVFVFTLTQLTGLLADDPTWTGLAKVVVLLSLIWWIYDGYVWLTNALDVVGHALLLLGGMAGFLVMALAIPTTFEEGGVAFGLGYLAVVALHSWLYIRATSASDSEAIRSLVPYNVATGLLLVAAGFLDGGLQWALIAAPALLLWFLPYITGMSMEGFQVAASHFVERHGLLVIVVLGESIVVLGVGAAGAEVGFELALIAVLALALSASLWWTYFCHEEEVEEAMRAVPPAARPRLALLTGYVHYFLLLGVILVAAALKKAIPDPLGDFGWETALVLPVGTAMFVAADTVTLRMFGIRFSAGRVVAVAAVLATIPIGIVSAAAQVAAIALIMAAALISDRPLGGTSTRTGR
jgi:low temperature requirement protein LtrA